jgi:hypothetical protein
VHQESVLEAPAGAIDVAEIIDRGALGVDAVSQRNLDRLAQRLPLSGLERPRAAKRMDVGTMQRLIRVDVADAGDTTLIEDERFDRSRPAARLSPKVAGGELGAEGLGTESRVQVLITSGR